VRAGRQSTVHWAAWRHYRRKLSGNFDVVVDQVNTIPFFTPFWSDVPIVMFIHQLAREVWWYESPFPVNAIGFVAENFYLRCYRHLPVLTVSVSTRRDLARLGFHGRITIIPEGIETVPDLDAVRPTQPSILYVGRLAPSKRVSDIIQAFALFSRSVGRAQLSLVGEGSRDYVKKLGALADRLGVSDRIRFLGRMSDLEKHHEMATAHILLVASVREGWGLVVTEANAFGTPAVAYDVPGLRDSVRDGETGLLADPTPKALAAAMLRLWQDRALYSRLAKTAKDWSGEFSYEATATAFREALVWATSRRGHANSPKVREGSH
jgi:glycosyltransferase involved in cell wall biosynthesis